MSGAIRIRREDGDPPRDLLVPYEVLIDDNQVGAVRRKGVETFPVQASDHTVRIKLTWAGSEGVMVTVRDGETARMVCRPGPASRRGIISVFTKGWQNWVTLEDERG